MQKTLFTFLLCLLLICGVLFSMWRVEVRKNATLTSQNDALAAEITLTNKTIMEKETALKEQNKKYLEVIKQIQYTDCENQPVSESLLNAAKGLQ